MEATHKIKAKIEAVLFACGEPVSLTRLCTVLEYEPIELSSIIETMVDEYEKDVQRGIKIIKLNDSYQLCTKEEFSAFVKAALDHRRITPLSPASMEVLTIVAYNEPVTKAYIEQIRGVDCSGVLNSLIEKELLEEKGRMDAPGKPLLYGTTKAFLRCFGIRSLNELPPLPDIS